MEHLTAQDSTLYQQMKAMRTDIQTVEKIRQTADRVTIHFSATSQETMSDKIKRMLRNEVQGM